MELYPIIIIKDRYTGVYSKGKFTAWNEFPDTAPKEINDEDIVCRDFWDCADRDLIGFGETPQDAYEDLLSKYNNNPQIFDYTIKYKYRYILNKYYISTQ